MSPLSLCREPGMFKHLFSSQYWEVGAFPSPFLKSDFHCCKIGIPPRSSDFISRAFHFHHMVSFWREAGRGSKICQRSIYKLTFGVGFSKNWSCLYPWVCLTTSEITQLNPVSPTAHTCPQGCHLLVGHSSASMFLLLCNLQERILRISLNPDNSLLGEGSVQLFCAL